MELIASTCARLYLALPGAERPAFLRRFLAAALSRQPCLKKETLPSVVSRFFTNALAVDPDDQVIGTAVGFYLGGATGSAAPSELPEAARATLLKIVASQPCSRTLEARLLAIAARCECPSGAVDAVGELLVRNWSNETFRAAMGWGSVELMLEDLLPPRWNACQVRLADALCDDETVAQDVLAAAFSDAHLQRDRWANVAKYIADRHRELVLDTVLALPDELAKPAVGTVCTVVNHVAGARTAPQRTQLARRLQRWIDTDPRRVWPSLIKVSSDDTDLLRDCARRLLLLRSADPADAATPTILRSSYDTFLNVCDPTQLAALDTDLRALLWATDKQDRNRFAELDGLTCTANPASRHRVNEHLSGTATNAAFAAARGLVAALESANRDGSDPATVEWLYGQLESPHANVVRLLAEALEKHLSKLPPQSVAGPLIGGRIARAIDRNEDPQTIGSLLALLIGLDKRGELGTDVRALAVDNLKQAVSDRLPVATSLQRRQHLPALFNLYKQALAALAIPHYPIEEIEAVIRTVLSDIDIGDIAGRSQRTMAHLLITAAGRSASIVPLLEELWPNVSAANKGAIAECISLLERHTTGERSKRLARRDDCPITIQNEIHTRFRH